jgi:hypothetical protein
MDERPAPSNGPDTGHYEIRLGVELDVHWGAWFGLLITHAGDGTTVLRGPVADQAALHGLLQRVRDLGLPLISVTRIDPTNPDTLERPTR